MKRLYVTVILILFFAAAESSQAACILPKKNAPETIKITSDIEDDNYSETDIIKKVSLKDKFKRSPESQIISFYKKFNKYSESNNSEKLKELYSDDYVNNDGFDKDIVFEMVKQSEEVYKNLVYETEIESIKVSGDYAEVKIHEVAQGETSNVLDSVKDTGNAFSEIYYTDYLKKENNNWKLAATYINSEIVSLSYGEAKYMETDLIAPDLVSAGSDYEVSFKTLMPGGSFVVGSITNEEILFPQKSVKDAFRSVKSDELARILKANTNNHNEYATVTIAITRAQVDPPSVMLDMTGIAFVMKRVNVMNAYNKQIIPEDEKVNEQEK